jgi:CTP:molybdopterin cytidylyltransferase MocA
VRVAGVVLAAGAGSRFGGDKLAASLDGRPLVRHVVDAAVAAGLDPIVVVVPPAGVLDGIDLAPGRSVVNETPEEGLSSSVRLGLRALNDDTVDAAVILPGDQPRVRPDVIRALVAAADERLGPPFVVARYAADAAPNPVLARREIWRLADELAGDHGFGPVLGAHPELVRDVPFDGANPDVDTRADLDRLADAPHPTATATTRAPASSKAGAGPGDVS